MNSEIHSATPTIVEDIDNGDAGSLNSQTGRDLYPGPGEQKKHPYLVEFDVDDPLNPKVRNRRASIFIFVYASMHTVMVKNLPMVSDDAWRCTGFERVSGICLKGKNDDN